jgi:UPF0716 family protein affecting phage T7 exclusion
MLQKFRTALHAFRTAQPGERFQGLLRRREKWSTRSMLPTALGLLGLLLIAAGVFFMVAPGPGFLIALLGLGVLATASRPVAALLDRTEVRLRRLWGRIRGK